MVTRVRVLFAVICLLFPSMASAADYVSYVIKRGENVSKIVLKLTGSSNYRKDGIVVAIMVDGKDTGRFVPKDKLGYVLPGWEVRIKQDLAKTELVKGSAGKTLAQVCVGSADPRCAPRLARLNGITTSRTPRSVIRSRMSRILADDVYALPGFLAPVVAKAKVVVDACLNIDGVQESIPPGWVADSKGNCGFPPPLPLPSSSASSFSFPPSYLLWLIPPLLIGIILFFRYRNRQSSARNSAIKSRLEDIASRFKAALRDLAGWIGKSRQRSMQLRTEQQLLAKKARQESFTSLFVQEFQYASKQYGTGLVWEMAHDPVAERITLRVRSEPYLKEEWPNLGLHATDVCRRLDIIMADALNNEPFQLVEDISEGKRRNPTQDGEWVVITFEAKADFRTEAA